MMASLFALGACNYVEDDFAGIEQYQHPTDIRTDTEGRLVPLSSLREKWIEAIGKHELPWINLLDTREGRPAEIIDNVYGIGAYPTKILIDPEGRIVDIFVGERPGFSEKLEASLKNRS